MKMPVGGKGGGGTFTGETTGNRKHTRSHHANSNIFVDRRRLPFDIGGAAGSLAQAPHAVL